MIINSFLTENCGVFAASITNLSIPENHDEIRIETKKSLIFPTKSNYFVTKLLFDNCILPRIPEMFAVEYPDIREIEIKDSTCSEVDINDLRKFKNLQVVDMRNVNFENYSGTIFGGLKDLKIKFESNDEDAEVKIQGLIGLGAAEKKRRSVLKAKRVNNPVTAQNTPVQSTPKPSSSAANQLSMFGTTPINCFSSPYSAPSPSFGYTPPSTVTAKPTDPKASGFDFGLTSSIKTDFTANNTDPNVDQKAYIFDQKVILNERNTKMLEMNNKLLADNGKMRDEISSLTAINKRLSESGYLADMRQIFSEEAFKDFTINVSYGADNKQYKVHKILFAARSSIIADMIRNEPEKAYELNLHDIPIPIFEHLLDFIYNESKPGDDDELIKIYAAAGGLNIVELKNIVAERLLNMTDSTNALKILKLSNKHGNDELRMKAFGTIRDMLPKEYKKLMTKQFSKSPDLIEKLLARKKALDDEFENARLEMNGGDAEDAEELDEASSGNSEGDFEVIH